MNEERFDEDFTWYEWTFVAPDEVPREDLQVPGEEEQRVLAAAGRRGEVDGWTWAT